MGRKNPEESFKKYQPSQHGVEKETNKKNSQIDRRKISKASCWYHGNRRKKGNVDIARVMEK